jgi:DNA repair protein RadD
VKLRPYQQGSIDALYDYFSRHTGNPLIVLPTGTGKSVVLAGFIKGAIDAYPSTRIVVLTHVKELIEQDAKAIIRYWNEAPIGVWSAGLRQKRMDQITVAGIQSVHRLPTKFGDTDIVIIDEAHLMPRNSETMYRRFIDGILKHNPRMKIVGLTATPFRVDSGLLTEGTTRVFTDVAYDAKVADMMKEGYLCPLVSKGGKTKPDLSGVHTRGGDYVPGELQDAMDKAHLIEGALDEIDHYAAERKSILGFCAGVEHAKHCAEAARTRGIAAEYVDGSMANGQRDRIINDFKTGRTRILFNAMMLTTGFDHPALDCLVLLRPTKSTGLYMQIMGRGTRPVYAPGHDLDTIDGRLAAIAQGSKPNCLVLDFAGNISRHGPIDQIKIKPKREKDEDAVSVAPVKECPDCHELVHTSVMLCPGCGHEWQRGAAHDTEASDLPVVAALQPPRTFIVDSVMYQAHEKPGKAPSLRVTYFCGIQSFDEWVPIEDDRPFVRKHAVSWFWKRGMMCPATVAEALSLQSRIPHTQQVSVKLDGKYWKVVDSVVNHSIPSPFQQPKVAA